jgi:hypothetical protein
MECPKCGTWNPDDKVRCWRCSAELPPPPKPRKSRKISSQTWLWVIAILFSLLTLLAQCGFFGGGRDPGTGFEPSWTPRQPLVRLGVRENSQHSVLVRSSATLVENDFLLIFSRLACNGGI